MEKEIIEIEVEKSVKQKTEEIFQKLGMTTEMAVKIFLNKVSIENGMPFNVKIEDKSRDDRSGGEDRRGRGGFSGGSRGGFSGGSRGGFGGGSRGGFGGGSRGGFGGRDRGDDRGDRGEKSGFGERKDRAGFGDKRTFNRDTPRDRDSKKEGYNLRGNLLDDSRRFSRKDVPARHGDTQPRRERKEITLNK